MNARVRAVTTLTMVLAAGALAAQAPAVPSAPLRPAEQGTRLITRDLLARKSELGLGQADDLRPGRAWVDGEGRTLTRFHQTHQGARVFGADLVAKLEAGGVRPLGRSLESGINLPVPPSLSGEQALRASHRELLPLGAYEATPSAELVVFPTRLAGGLRPKVDLKAGITWDRETSVLAPRPAAAHVWAYEVVSLLNNPQDGVQEMHVVVDARTGDVLRKWDAAASFRPRAKARRPRTYEALERAKGPMAVVPSALARPMVSAAAGAVSTPALGTGLSQYSGTVVLGTSANPGGGFDLWDQTRAVNPANPNGVWLTTGITTNFVDLFQPGFVPLSYGMANQAGSLDNAWGDGQNYAAPPPNLPNDAYNAALFHWGDSNGQTAAVDAHYAATATYDMYKNVLGRASIDGNDGGIFSVVHYGYLYDNAAWVDSFKLMLYGDGSYPYSSGGMRSMTSLDVGGHEMTHGVNASEADLNYWDESGGLNEANSDMFSQAVVAYSKRAAGDPADKIPAVALSWALGAELTPDHAPFRSMVRPSLDGMSPDAWFYGMGMLDVHYSSGPGNRFFYFLAEGANSNPQSVAHSPYLPQGMTGIGLDKATRIWYKALTEQFTPATNYAGARAGSIQAATDLYGSASAEVAAVENAFAAINVGAAHGQPARVVVTFPENLIATDSPLDVLTRDSTVEGIFSRTLIVPANNVCELKVNVANATDPSVIWKAGIGEGFFSPAGTPLNVTSSNGSFDEQGRYHSPVAAPLWCGVRAFSMQEPLQFGAAMVFTARMDADGDTEHDALDAGMLALVWNLKTSVTQEISPFPDPEGNGFVDEVSVQLWREAFKNAFEK